MNVTKTILLLIIFTLMISGCNSKKDTSAVSKNTKEPVAQAEYIPEPIDTEIAKANPIVVPDPVVTQEPKLEVKKTTTIKPVTQSDYLEQVKNPESDLIGKTIVYITKDGKHFHLVSCGHLRWGSEAVTLTYAKSLGRTACINCNSETVENPVVSTKHDDLIPPDGALADIEKHASEKLEWVKASESSIKVYVTTSNGKHYHLESCGHLRYGKKSMTLYDAKKAGYTNCINCNSEEITSEMVSKLGQ